MKEKIKVAIFGLSLSVQDNLKKQIEHIFEDMTEVIWETVQAAEIDILLVNDLFFNSQSVQHLINKNVPYLRLHTHEDCAGKIEGDALYLPFVATEQNRAWFIDRYLQVPIRKQILNQRNSLSHQFAFHQIVQEFFNEQNGNIQVFDEFGNLALMNTKTEQVWVLESRKKKGTNSSLNYTYATMQMTQSLNQQQGKDLQHWLWNTFWHSPELYIDHPMQQFYKLKTWPQPEIGESNTEIFSIAAYFEKGANIHTVHTQTNIALSTIKKFVSVSVLSGMMKEIEPHEAAINDNNMTHKNDQIQSFFGYS